MRREKHTRARLAATILLAGAVFMADGCGGKNPSAYLGERPLGTRGTEIGKSVEGRPIDLVTLGNGPDVVLIMGTIHGNENAGTPLILALAKYLEENTKVLEGRTLLLIPVVNPDGYYYNRRFNSSDVDLNRNFPAENRDDWKRSSGPQPLSEPESQAIESVLTKYHPSRIVSMHEPLETIDWDGPGESLAQHMGKFVSLPVERIGSRPGSLGSHAGEELGIPIITLEFPQYSGTRPAQALWKDYGRVLLAAITFPADPPETD